MGNRGPKLLLFQGLPRKSGTGRRNKSVLLQAFPRGLSALYIFVAGEVGFLIQRASGVSSGRPTFRGPARPPARGYSPLTACESPDPKIWGARHRVNSGGGGPNRPRLPRTIFRLIDPFFVATVAQMTCRPPPPSARERGNSTRTTGNGGESRVVGVPSYLGVRARKLGHSSGGRNLLPRRSFRLS